MADGYDCYQNALAERVNGTLKNELLPQCPIDLKQARQMVREAADIYNHEQPHLALKYKTPPYLMTRRPWAARSARALG
ncbi:integrase [Pseudomonas sp. MT-1]|nr:integrase [Pseudomonas sp. MT-1]